MVGNLMFFALHLSVAVVVIVLLRAVKNMSSYNEAELAFEMKVWTKVNKQRLPNSEFQNAKFQNSGF